VLDIKAGYIKYNMESRAGSGNGPREVYSGSNLASKETHYGTPVLGIVINESLPFLRLVLSSAMREKVGRYHIRTHEHRGRRKMEVLSIPLARHAAEAMQGTVCRPEAFVRKIDSMGKNGEVRPCTQSLQTVHSGSADIACFAGRPYPKILLFNSRI
jgi:hypothetical protein